jgi:hypothetical protein
MPKRWHTPGTPWGEDMGVILDCVHSRIRLDPCSIRNTGSASPIMVCTVADVADDIEGPQSFMAHPTACTDDR